MPGPGAPRPARPVRPPLVVAGAAAVVLVLLAVVGLGGVSGAGAQATTTTAGPTAPGVLATTTTTSPAPTAATTATGGTPLRVRAFGDSITAGYGFFADGTQWGISDLLQCRPPAAFMNDRCSSNSTLGPGADPGPPVFSADYGLGNNVSWAAQVATTLGSVDYANYAVTGSTPRQWMNLQAAAGEPDNGTYHDLLERLEADDPDLVLMTLGANPLLSDFLMGSGMACSLFDDEATQRQLFLDCIDAIIDEQLVSQRLTAVYIDVLAHTTEARIVASRYYLAIPAITLFDEWQAQAMVDGVNAQVESAVAAVKGSGAQYAARIAISDPPRFDSGWPGTGPDATCGATVPADGPSRQGYYAQAMLLARAGSLGFCVSDQPWTIDADTGIHPDRDGHRQLADAALAVIRANGWQVPSR